MIIKIKNRIIGPAHPTYIVAEMSANHNQDFDTAVKILKAAKEAGADAIKLQTYTPETMTLDCDKDPFKIKQGTLWEGRNLFDLYKEAQTPWEWHPKLKKLADELGLDFFSSPFDATAVDFLEKWDVSVYKIASFELVDLPLIEKAAKTKKPIIMSTGMATISEIEEAVQTARRAGNTDLILLKCTSAYPASPEEMNLRTLPHLSETFDVPVGLSDHTEGSAVSVSAISLGACVIEKHFTLSRKMEGPDHSFSMEPSDFKRMVEDIRMAEKALGKVRYEFSEKESHSRIFRRSLFVVKDLKAGETLNEENVRVIRPGLGLHPRHLKEIAGKKIIADVPRGTPLTWDKIQ